MDATRPASRILVMLDILQDHPGITGPQLAQRLGVSSRTVRRYVGALQEMGIPVEPVSGRYGGYRLMSNFRLPPLMFSGDEAIGLALAIIAARPHGFTEDDHPAQRAISKIERVVPPDLARKISEIREGVIMPSRLWDSAATFPDPDVLATLIHACLTTHRVWFRYSRADGDESAREIDPYGVVAIYGRWYVHGWCHLREACRTFRVDRIRRVDELAPSFAKPVDVDVLEAVETSLALARGWRVGVLVDAPLEMVRQHVPGALAVLSRDGEDRTRLEASSDDLEWFAWRLMNIPYDLTIIEPPALREAFARIAARMQQIASRTADEVGTAMPRS
jgi:predicted DNA-binding transcriptional regulator YafY